MIGSVVACMSEKCFLPSQFNLCKTKFSIDLQCDRIIITGE